MGSARDPSGRGGIDGAGRSLRRLVHALGRSFLVGNTWSWNTTNTGSVPEFYGGTAWRAVGGQTYAGRANAREEMGYSIRDEDSSKCLVAEVSLKRYRLDSSGLVYSMGGTCPPASGYTLETTQTYTINNCTGGGSAADWLTRTHYLVTNHAEQNSYVPQGGGWWQYYVELYHAVGEYSAGWGSASYSCFSIYWWQ